jgi:hypothetical protein
MENRATENWQKRDVLEKILDSWLALPELRLGQLLQNAIGNAELFYIEDYDLVNDVVSFKKSFEKAPQ